MVDTSYNLSEVILSGTHEEKGSEVYEVYEVELELIVSLYAQKRGGRLTLRCLYPTCTLFKRIHRCIVNQDI